MSRARILTLVAMVVVTGLGYGAKCYRGPADGWVNNFGPASVAYEMLFMLLFFFVSPRKRSILPIAATVCILTCALEFAQLWHPAWLDALRATFLGRALLGHQFSWWDLPAYPIGCLAGWFLLRWICQTTDCPSRSSSSI